MVDHIRNFLESNMKNLEKQHYDFTEFRQNEVKKAMK